MHRNLNRKMLNKFRFINTILFLLVISCNEPSERTNADASIGKSDNTIHFVEISGSFFQKGKTYGIATKLDIQGQLKIWEALCRKEINLSLDEVYDFIKSETGFLNAIDIYAPQLLEEVKGMAKGANVSYQHLITLNLAEEIMVFFSGGYESCTNIALETEEANLLAFNLDLPDFLMQYRPVVLKDKELFIYAFPGIIATGGINRHFAVTTNSLSNLMMDTTGLPLPFMIRKLLGFNNEADAIQFLKNTPLAAPQNIMIVGKKAIYDFECSANQKVKYQNSSHPHLLYHTNHPLINTDINTAVEIEPALCERFTYLDSLYSNPNLSNMSLNKISLKQAISHQKSNIRYEGNYFSYLATFLKHEDSLPKVEILIPKLNSKMKHLKFN